MWSNTANGKTMNLLKVGAPPYRGPPPWLGMYFVMRQWQGQINNLYWFGIQTHHREEKVKHKIERIFRIWEQRVIYNEEFLTDLRGLLSINPTKKPLPTESDDEQATITVANLKNCIKLEKETDRSFKALPKAPLCDKETIAQLKGKLGHSQFCWFFLIMPKILICLA